MKYGRLCWWLWTSLFNVQLGVFPEPRRTEIGQKICLFLIGVEFTPIVSGRKPCLSAWGRFGNGRDAKRNRGEDGWSAERLSPFPLSSRSFDVPMRSLVSLTDSHILVIVFATKANRAHTSLSDRPGLGGHPPPLFSFPSCQSRKPPCWHACSTRMVPGGAWQPTSHRLCIAASSC